MKKLTYSCDWTFSFLENFASYLFIFVWLVVCFYPGVNFQPYNLENSTASNVILCMLPSGHLSPFHLSICLHIFSSQERIFEERISASFTTRILRAAGYWLIYTAGGRKQSKTLKLKYAFCCAPLSDGATNPAPASLAGSCFDLPSTL